MSAGESDMVLYACRVKVLVLGSALSQAATVFYLSQNSHGTTRVSS